MATLDRTTHFGGHHDTVDEAIAARAYPLQLDGAAARYLDRLLAKQNTEEAAEIRAQLNFTLPKFEIGDTVMYWRESFDERVFTVTGHRWVSPGNWSCWLEDADGEHFGAVGEVYLRKAEH